MWSRTHHEDVGVLGPGRFEDRFGRIAMPDDRGRHDARGACPATNKLGATFHALAIVVSLRHREDLQDGVVPGRQGDRLLGRPYRGLFEVGGKENVGRWTSCGLDLLWLQPGAVVWFRWLRRRSLLRMDAMLRSAQRSGQCRVARREGAGRHWPGGDSPMSQGGSSDVPASLPTLRCATRSSLA